MDPFAPGTTWTWERAFTTSEVRAFAELSGDRGRHHTEPDASGRLMVHGLLTASLPTKIGGDLHFIAREMRFEFLRPVWTGETIRCEVRVERATPEPRRVALVFAIRCTNERGEEVLRGTGTGVIRTDPSPPTGPRIEPA